ncbi:unnamed protein product [Lactuca saligna]|uniref:Uncharacterized protein n=1 Tax=Lactuca saligna TaxID=75948 RepID=A0AA35Y4F5_LACSI|nr:unnamed protein product [Lactuca saligna]
MDQQPAADICRLSDGQAEARAITTAKYSARGQIGGEGESGGQHIFLKMVLICFKREVIGWNPKYIENDDELDSDEDDTSIHVSKVQDDPINLEGQEKVETIYEESPVGSA